MYGAGVPPVDATDCHYLPLQKPGVHHVDGQKRIVYRADGGPVEVDCRFLRQWRRTIVDDCLHQRFLIGRRHGRVSCKLIDGNSGVLGGQGLTGGSGRQRGKTETTVWDLFARNFVRIQRLLSKENISGFLSYICSLIKRFYVPFLSLCDEHAKDHVYTRINEMARTYTFEVKSKLYPIIRALFL